MLKGTLAAEVAAFLRTQGDGVTAIRLSEKIANQCLPADLQSGYVFFASLCLAIDKVKITTIGHSASTNHSNYLMFLVGAQWVKRLSCNSEESLFLEKITKSLENSGSWMYVKAYNLLVLVNRKRITNEFATKIKAPNWVHLFVKGAYTATTDAVLDSYMVELIQTMDQLRKYGIKNAAYHDLYSRATKTQWVVIDPKQMQQGTKFISGRTIGVFHLTDDSVQDFRLNHQQKEKGAYSMSVSHVGYQPQLTWSLDDRGHLDLSEGFGILPVKEIFDQAGTTSFYDALRLTAIMRIYDLVVPMTTVQGVPFLDRQKSLLASIFTGSFLGNGLRDLILPRLRSLENIDQVENELQQEIEGDINAERKRRLREHEVIGFARKIRPGYFAPKSIVELAWEESEIILQPGETYVRKHKRGDKTFGIVTGHRIKKKARHGR